MLSADKKSDRKPKMKEHKLEAESLHQKLSEAFATLTSASSSRDSHDDLTSVSPSVSMIGQKGETVRADEYMLQNLLEENNFQIAKIQTLENIITNLQIQRNAISSAKFDTLLARKDQVMQFIETQLDLDTAIHSLAYKLNDENEKLLPYKLKKKCMNELIEIIMGKVENGNGNSKIQNDDLDIDITNHGVSLDDDATTEKPKSEASMMSTQDLSPPTSRTRQF